jgi:hypothetical protein
MLEPADHQFAGLVIGQEFETSAHAVLRVVAIDPEMRCVVAEDPSGTALVDDISHFTATHRPSY